MKPIFKLALAAGVAGMATQGQAQSIGAACGCPPVGSRTTVTLDPTNAPTVLAANGDMIPSSYTMTCNNLYILNDKFYVPDGKDLYIEPGTVIKAPNIGGGNAAALIVSRGGQLWANGTESCPIIFTAQADPLDGSYAVTNRGRWGGIILLGRAYNNVRTTDVGSVSAVTGINGVGLIEGLTNESRNYYGMPVGQEINNDNSGVLRYVSIRHGGELLGANNEINGLTMGSVGTGTVIENIEVIGNLDDGIEFFGGTVNAKNLVVMHCDDDYIDWDQAYDGRIQFVYGLQGPDNRGGALNQGDNGLELDRDDHPTNAANGGLSGAPQIWNATIFARTDGSNADPVNLNPANTSGDEAIEAKERATGAVNNSIFVNFRSGLNLIGAVGGGNTTDNWTNGTFSAKNNTFINCANPLRINGANVTSGAQFTQFTTTDGNVVLASGLVDATFDINPMLTSNTVTDRVNPVPAAGTATTNLKPAITETYLTAVQYRGAFEPGKEPWTKGWTLIEQIKGDLSTVAGCVGDLNKDGVINSADFTLFSGAFGTTCF